MTTFCGDDSEKLVNRLAYVLEGLEHTIEIENIDYGYMPAANSDLALIRVRIRLHPADLKNLNERLSRL